MYNKLVTIITPTYNCVDKIENTICSVLNQKASLYEYVIVDGISTDGTLDIIKKYTMELKWISEKDNGIYDAMNKGIFHSNGQYLYFLGAGDILKEGILEKIEHHLCDQQNDFVYGNVLRLDTKKIYNGKYNQLKLMTSNICHQAIFYKKNIFQLIGNYEIKYQLLADYALNLKCFSESSIIKKYINEIISEYEGDGLSIVRPDIVFENDFPELIRTNLGIEYFLLFKFKKKMRKILRTIF